MLATKEGKVVASHGDVLSPVNRGLNCVKGYFLSKIMYGEDRLTKPLLRKKDGKYDKNGNFEPVSWDEACDIMAEKFKEAIAQKGPTRRLAIAWPLPLVGSSARSALMNQWAVMMILKLQMPLSSGALTWQRCTPYYGHA